MQDKDKRKIIPYKKNIEEEKNDDILNITSKNKTKDDDDDEDLILRDFDEDQEQNVSDTADEEEEGAKYVDTKVWQIGHRPIYSTNIPLICSHNTSISLIAQLEVH